MAVRVRADPGQWELSVPLKLLAPLVLMLMAALVIGGCQRQVPQALGTLEWERVNGRAIASEVIEEVHVGEGDFVDRDAPLLKLDSTLIDARVVQLQAAVEHSRWLLRELEAGARPQELEQARAVLAAAESDLAASELAYRRQRQLAEQGHASERDLEHSRNLHEGAVARRREAVAGLSLVTAGARPEQLAQARTRLRQAEAELQYERTLRRRYTVRAARAGRVDSLVFKLGDKPPAGAVLVTVLVGERPYARVYVPEPWRRMFHPGGEFPVRVDGIEQVFVGRVRKLSAEPSFTPYFALTERDRSRLSYLAELDLQEPGARRLAAGQPVQVALPAL